MRRHSSVLALAARHTVGWAALLLTVTALGETALFWWALGSVGEGIPPALEQVLGQAHVPLVAAGTFLALCALLGLSGCELQGSRFGYTLRRLRVREETATLWFAGCNAVCLLALWGVQLAAALGCCALYRQAVAPDFVSRQTELLAFYRTGFLHSLLPMAEWSGYVRNVLLLLAMALSTACLGYRQRRRRVSPLPVLAAAVVVLTFSQEMGRVNMDVVLSLGALGAIAMEGLNLVRGWRGELDED